jgi:hypothetical protein
VVDTSTRRMLLRVHQASNQQNVNDLTFAPSGAGDLYISSGDGGHTRQGTPVQFQTNAQLTTNPYGKILRIDVDSIGPNGRYAIPPDNPFPTGAGGNVPEIFAWGLRNPWRISADRLTGTLYTASNGDFTIEWVNRVEVARNYGWAVKEGGFLWDPATGNASVDPAPNPAFTPPLAQYDHNWTSQGHGSVIGGFVYRGARMPALYGKYLLLDWLAGDMMAMNTSTGALERIAISPSGSPLSPFNPISWGEDEVGELWIGGFDGSVLKVGPVVLCGDLDFDLDLGQADSLRARQGLAASPPLNAAELARCSVSGALSCDLLDAVLIRRAEFGLQPGVAPVCDDAT